MPLESSETFESSQIKPFGHHAHIMKDQLYWLERGHVFTTPCVSVSISQRFYVMVVISLDDAEFLLECGDFRGAVRAAVIAPGIPRRIHAPGIRLISFHINPLHGTFASFRALLRSGPVKVIPGAFDDLKDAMSQAWRGELCIHSVVSLHDRVAARASRLMPPQKAMDPRIRDVLGVLHGQETPPSLEEISEAMGLSYHWMSRLFADSVGLPLRTYCLWRKVHGASQVLLQIPPLVAHVRETGFLGGLGSSGMSLTALAHEAGFADSAHLAHTMAELCGGPLSHFLFSGDVRLHLLPVSQVDEAT